ncbi:hypothetical protein BGZ73_001443 [Actinomortierella ambigua]|nr:hypothetical protein BGZ73_001443 [Actinomortierella ambigua]
MSEAVASSLWESLGVPALEFHWRALLLSAFTCSLIVQTSQRLSPYFFPKTYPQLRHSQQLNWDVHVVSTVHATTIVALSVPLLFHEGLLQDKVFGYDTYAGNVYAVACGYFLWDTIHSIRHFKDFGLGFVFHGICSFSVFIFSFDKLNMTGSIYQLVNGIVLLVAFFCVRIVFGIYMSWQTYLSVLPVIDRVPTHLIFIYTAANIVLNSLNLFWFYKMIQMVQRRFKGGSSRSSSSTSSASSKGRKEMTKSSLKGRKEQ